MARNAYYRTFHWKALKQACHERDGWKCVVPGCLTPTYRLTCDHIERRPNVDYPTSFDVIGNTRTLCGSHDSQVKERTNGRRLNGGALVERGVHVDGTPADPKHPWAR